MKRLRTGDLNQKIDIQKRSTTQDQFGQQTDSWTTIASPWCSVQTFGAQESVQGSVEVSTYKYKFRLRFDSALERIRNNHRVLFKGRELDIIGVENLHEKDVELIITALETE